MHHKGHQAIERELETAKLLVKINGVYSHYKNPSHLVRVVAIGTQEATDKLCVIYRDEANKNLIFVRDLDIWLEKPLKGIYRVSVSPRENSSFQILNPIPEAPLPLRGPSPFWSRNSVC